MLGKFAPGTPVQDTQAQRGETVPVAIESGTQVASRGSTGRITTPRFGLGATTYPLPALRDCG